VREGAHQDTEEIFGMGHALDGLFIVAVGVFHVAMDRMVFLAGATAGSCCRRLRHQQKSGSTDI